MRKSALLALLVLIPPFLPAARLTLRDGSVINGQFISGTAETILFQDHNGVRRRFETRQVQNIDFENLATQPAASTAHCNSDPDSQSDWAVIPAGGFVSLRVESDIFRQNMSSGRTWQAVIVQDVMEESGKVMIPRGTSAIVAVRRVAAGTTLTGASYVLELDSVRLGGRRYVADKTEAALGTLIGSSPEGAPLPVLTAGPEIRVPAQTVLRFRLESALRLREGEPETRP